MFWLFDHICIPQYLMELHCAANLISDRHLRMYIFDKEQSDNVNIKFTKMDRLIFTNLDRII